jgi:hypothetical protein
LARDPEFKASWQAIKARFDVDKFRDYKQIVRRRLVAERSMREDWQFRWRSPDDCFRAVFDVFCQRWKLVCCRGCAKRRTCPLRCMAFVCCKPCRKLKIWL